MSLPTISLRHAGFFAGQFVLTDEKGARTLGPEVTMRAIDSPRLGESFEVGTRTVHGFLLPVQVNDKIYCELPISTGAIGQFWRHELLDGKRKPVSCHKIEKDWHTWYVPNIDGWTIGIMGQRVRSTPVGEPA